MQELDQLLMREWYRSQNLPPRGISSSLAVKEEVAMKFVVRAARLKKAQVTQAQSLEMQAQMSRTWRKDLQLPVFLTMQEASLKVVAQFLPGEVVFQQVVIVYWTIAEVIVMLGIQLVKS